MIADKNKIVLPRSFLGNSGLEVSRLGMGCFHQLEISTDVIEKVVNAYLDVGGNYIETARLYGNGASEEKLGRVLGNRRKEVVLASKSFSRDGDGLRKDLETSLSLLKTDFLDLYYIHCVVSKEELDTITGADGALSALLKAKEEGLIGGIGLSSHRPPEMYLEAMERLPLSVILIWDNLLEELYLPEIQKEVYPAAREKGVGVLAMKPLADGFFYRSVENALRYAMGSGSEVLVCGMNSPDHVYQAAEAVCKGPATAEERQEILANAMELGNYVCRQCGDCSDDLMALFRLEGYVDRQMLDYLPHDPANFALRTKLSDWYRLANTARRKFAAGTWHLDQLLAEASSVECRFGIKVERKLKITLAKLRGEDTDFI